MVLCVFVCLHAHERKTKRDGYACVTVIFLKPQE